MTRISLCWLRKMRYFAPHTIEFDTDHVIGVTFRSSARSLEICYGLDLNEISRNIRPGFS